MRAHQIMTRPVFTVLPDASVLEAANLMLQRHISGLPVVAVAGKLVGLVSEGDFVRRSEMGTPRRRSRLLKCILGPGRAPTEFVHEHGRKIAESRPADPVTISPNTRPE